MNLQLFLLNLKQIIIITLSRISAAHKHKQTIFVDYQIIVNTWYFHENTKIELNGKKR